MVPDADAAPILAAELTRDAYDAMARERLFVLPLGILEEHGPHLPLGTDTYQVEAVVNEAAAATGAVVLPTLWYGNTVSTRPFPGSISIRTETLRAITVDILEELVRHGVRTVAIVSGHAGSGHHAAVKQACRDVLEAGHDIGIAYLSEWDLLLPLGGGELAGVQLPEGDGHAGTMETARMMALRPELIGERPGANVVEDEPFVVSIEGMPLGYGGDPSLATAELGDALHRTCVDGLVELFERLSKR